VRIGHCFDAEIAPSVDVEIGRSSRPGHDLAFVHFTDGYMLTGTTTDCRFNLSTNNIVHLTIRPQDLVDADEEEQKRIADGRPRDRSEERRSPRCCIIL
jgi:hypothetical protein